MVNRFNFGGGNEGFDSNWKMENISDFKKWIADNKFKTDEGLEAMKQVMSIGCDIASAAAVKWFREKGMEQAWVSARVSQISDAIVNGCDEGKESVVKDCATLYAGTGNVMMVMMMAFVSYSLIGVNVAESLIGSDC